MNRTGAPAGEELALMKPLDKVSLMYSLGVISSSRDMRHRGPKRDSFPLISGMKR